ncbi:MULTISPECIES: inositol monophosphatase family protein [unclassified Schaalia]|uniref:inositol monophosphatase family protein n=1 Tax=unclassified Schaalia TaxID=2691889 RepID=UPI001E4599F5|nr:MULTISPECIES: inositol monophosphatase family protein [unclassified Schaalia]MCD4549271.1 histidinol phosphatase [Schaalia sp. lx-260]MCD4557080.1 histidinol phosphatase [Schaalia sp. lx-100]
MTCTRSYADDLQLALDLADLADDLTLARFRADDLLVESKPDLTPVSDADRLVEDQIRTRLSQARPTDAIIGEERGSFGASSRMWVIDPIDGTRNFIRGVPVWATLIALIDEKQPVVGVVSAPALQRRWWAAQDLGAWMSSRGGFPERLSVSRISRVEDAFVSYSSLHGWDSIGLDAEMCDVLKRAWYTRAYGDFWSYMLVAEGAVDIACEPELALHDMAALVPIVREAGGVFTSVHGVEGPWGGSALAANPLLHTCVQNIFLHRE